MMDWNREVWLNLNDMINQAIRFGICVYIVVIRSLYSQGSWCCRCYLTNEGNSNTFSLTSKINTVDRGQAQSSTTTGELQAVVIPLIDTFMKRLQQGGLLWRIALKEGADLSMAAKRG